MVFTGGSVGKESACNAGDLGSIPGLEDLLEKEMATHCSIFPWRIHGQRSLVGYSLWVTESRTAARQASLSFTISQSLHKLMPIELMIPSNHLVLCCPLLLLPSIFPSIRVFSNDSALCIRWSKYWSFSFNISPSNEQPGLISFRMDWLDLLAVQFSN